MNNLDKQYTALLQDILDNGHQKEDRTGTGTISVFGRQIRHKMSEGFPLLTTKKMYMKGIVTELIWFLRGDTNIKYLVDNDCHIWDGDAYKNYESKKSKWEIGRIGEIPKLSLEDFINKIKTDDEFAKKWGDLGPVYGKQWRSWGERKHDSISNEYFMGIDQIANLINDLKTNPDSRRLMVNAWNVGEINQMTLPPCHYGFQVYTRELDETERVILMDKKLGVTENLPQYYTEDDMIKHNIPTRAISLMWNQRSVDTFLGLPFNIASYGLLLEIIAKAVNMVPDELIGNLGDTHLYSNHIEQAKEQIGRELSLEEQALAYNDTLEKQNYNPKWQSKIENIDNLSENELMSILQSKPCPKRTREPYPLPTLNINTEFWSYEGGECGVGPLDAVKVFEAFKDENFCRCLLEEDIQLGNYQSHPTIKAPLSN
jgi:thymidylate synthase